MRDLLRRIERKWIRPLGRRLRKDPGDSNVQVRMMELERRVEHLERLVREDLGLRYLASESAPELAERCPDAQS